MPFWAWGLVLAGALALVLGLLLGLPPQARGIKRILWLEYAEPIWWQGEWVTRRPITVIEGHWLPRLWGTGGLSLWKSTVLLKYYGRGVMRRGEPAVQSPAETAAHEIVHSEQKRVEGGLRYLVGSAWHTVTIRQKQNRPREAAAYLAERPLVEGRYPAFRVVGLTDAYWPLGKMTREA